MKTYYIKSIEDIEKDKGEMICLAEYHNARIYISLNKRSFERTCYHTLQKVTDQIMNKDYSQARKAYNSACGTHTEGNKTWVVDIDETGRVANDILKFIDTLQPEGNKLISVVPTKHGVHLITKPFNLQDFKEVFPAIEVHKNNPTILYVP